MRRSVRARLVVAAMIGLVTFGCAIAAAPQALPTGEPFAVESSVVVPLDEATAISIVGIRGHISVSTGAKRQLQVISRATGPSGAELSVGVWLDGSKLIVAPAPGDAGRARRIDVEVPRGVAIAVDAAYSDIVILAQGGVVDLRGDNVSATVQVVGGSLIADLLAGTLAVRDSKDATARFRGTVTAISAMTGDVTVHTEGGKLWVSTVDGATNVDSEASRLTFENLAGPLHVKARQGEVAVVGIKSDAEFELVGTALRMKEGVGDITVKSDAAVVFQAMAGSLGFDMRGGSLLGQGNIGDLAFRGSNTDVKLESITGVVSVRGDGLTAGLVDVGGELQLEATHSSVAVDRAGDIVLTVDTGSVSINQAAGSVKANVTGGNVRILEGLGAVTLEMDGGDGEVSWAALSGEPESNLTNAGGKLTVRFSGSCTGRVVAKSDYGRIDNELEDVKVADDFGSARGSVNGGDRPYVRINASGDIRLENVQKAR